MQGLSYCYSTIEPVLKKFRRIEWMIVRGSASKNVTILSQIRIDFR